MSFIRRRKLTKNQTRQIHKNQDQIIDDGSLATGVVVSHFGKQLAVQITALPTKTNDAPSQSTHAKSVKDDESGENSENAANEQGEPIQKPLAIGDVWRCHARTNLPMLAAGDVVQFSVDMVAGTGLIEVLKPRRTLITRPDRYHKVKPVAANADVLVIVFAPLPKPAVNLIDRYLLVARTFDVKPLLVLNKADLLAEHQDVVQIFQEYQELGEKYGFEILATSGVSGQGVDELQARIDGKLAIFAGQSGVGKSSLINRLLPHAEQATNEISVGSQLGQHTTTTSRLLAYDDGNLEAGGIIDTPGIREYGVWHLPADEVLAGFDELNALAGECQFRDCSHAPNAKGCALWQAAQAGQVLPRRIESLLELMAEAGTQDKAVK
ncbi:ribosome small subunit-dependent GTPase A [Moraxella caviae]|uniref:Small ribosomal subunit biogenesis GTPase RsgA n=1 Tax=Moraxella caviae TaxID=34060 RepID=A0A1S9ZU93_9GAMM|nr:ribosome small subunit-dependent GTPase A [Moraxella caviae]OOR87010.1 ribosome small subunit-dependent GTPase A [Moraxella caviae]STZ10018.1 Putative ribosome biogenesis GTPase RsgA [Moraxella caviae]VEW13209.1 Putative ribosome biogenesis GTPase RsgA [Moraxella caviae]